jgi:hypothetical protein
LVYFTVLVCCTKKIWQPCQWGWLYSSRENPVLKTCFGGRVARFLKVHGTKTGKMYQINIKCTKWS